MTDDEEADAERKRLAPALIAKIVELEPAVGRMLADLRMGVWDPDDFKLLSEAADLVRRWKAIPDD